LFQIQGAAKLLILKVEMMLSRLRHKISTSTRWYKLGSSTIVLISGPAILFAIWFVAYAFQLVDANLLPSPISTLADTWHNTVQGNMLEDFWHTFVRVAYAFVFSAVAGVPAGIILGVNDRVYRSVEFLIDFFRSTPATAMFPLFLLLFGLGDFSKVAVAAFAGWLVVVFNVAYGVMNARKTRMLAAKSMGASRSRIFFDVVFFETLPQTFVGIRTGISIALVVIIVAEMFIGATDGLGHRIIDAQISYDLTDMYGSILVTGVMGYGLNLFFLGIEKRLIHWSGK
jgi:NitT/TauT family transport system permease protein